MSFQERCWSWVSNCFGSSIASSKEERNLRFLEEAVELVQACGMSETKALQTIYYVYGRPIGDPKQEVGGVMITLANLCTVNKIDMNEAGEADLASATEKSDKIAVKWGTKPKHLRSDNVVEAK